MLCVSPLGLVNRVAILDGSGAPSWDLQLFEAIRRWRYRASKPARPEPQCGLYRFIYNQRS
jgi:hypothetical protein